MYSNRLRAILLVAVCLSQVTGCVGKSPPAQFYMLEPASRWEGDRTANEPAGDVVIMLGPVQVAKYLDRPQIVTAVGKNLYKINEWQRWAERLDENIPRILAQNLALMVPAETVLLNVSNRSNQARFRVAVNILEFHVDPQGQAVLTARWRILRGDEMVLGKQASYRVPSSTTDYRTMVEALNECLNRLSQEIATALRQQLALLH